MDYTALAQLLFPNVTDTPEILEEKYPQRNLPEGAVVTRMAPSPTGFVHFLRIVHAWASNDLRNDYSFNTIEYKCTSFCHIWNIA